MEIRKWITRTMYATKGCCCCRCSVFEKLRSWVWFSEPHKSFFSDSTYHGHRAFLSFSLSNSFSSISCHETRRSVFPTFFLPLPLNYVASSTKLTNWLYSVLSLTVNGTNRKFCLLGFQKKCMQWRNEGTACRWEHWYAENGCCVLIVRIKFLVTSMTNFRIG